MANRLRIVLLGLVVFGTSLVAQQFPPGYVDPKPVLQAAVRAIGADRLNCVTMSGTGYAGMVGQAHLNDKNVDWPRSELTNYTRTMNWEARTMQEEFDRKPGLTPASWKHGLGFVGGTPLQKNPHQIFVVNGTTAWHYDGAGSQPIASRPEDGELWQLDMWINPHGFLKAAMMPGANPKAVWRWELGEMGRDLPDVQPEKVTIVSIMVMGKYRVDATINNHNMLQRIHTSVPDPVYGDMNYEHEFTDETYVDLGNGMKFPTRWHSHVGYDDNYQAQSFSSGHNGFGGNFKDVKANACAAPPGIPDAVRRADFSVRVETQKLADGVYLLGGTTHNSVAIEFKDYIAVVEAPLDEPRNLAVIDQVVKLIPNKPIRYLVNTHQHSDHIGGLRTYMHIGATIITHWRNWPFYTRDVLNYAPRTLKPDILSWSPPTEMAEGYFYEQVTGNYVLTDGSRNLNLYYVQPLRHADGMLMAYLPKERMLIEADLFDTHEPPPATPTPANTSLNNLVQRLKLDVAQIVPIHGKPVPWSAFSKVIGTKTN
jgi:glyoxylase-like metal-dependent hydrolase (beta-lactamase superfamily II)